MKYDTKIDEAESDDEFFEPREYPKKRSRAASLIHDVASIPKRAAMRLDLAPSRDTQMDADGRTVPGITDNPAFNPSLVFPQQRAGVHASVSKTVNAVQKAGSAIAHPKATIKMTAAAKVPIDETPYLTEEADKELLMAQEELWAAEASAEEFDAHTVSDMASDAEPLREIRVRRITELEEHRSAMRAAWITSKHVKRVRVVPRRHIRWPRRTEYYELDGKSQKSIFRWDQYLGHLLLYISQDYTTQYVDDCHNEVPFNRNVLLDHVQRLLIATAPWQAWMMDVRKVARWEDPWLTGKWFCIYLVLIKTGYIMTFFYGYVVYITLRSRYTSHTERIQTLRDAYTRAHDQHSRVAKLTELIRRHGNDQWLDPLLDELGPIIQAQVGDAADFCEILQNFYHWVNPRMTACALVFWASCFLTAAFTSAEYGAKIFWYVSGFYFFWSRPLASRYPAYRKVVSLFRWIYWGIPTYAELAMSQLRSEAAIVRKQLTEDDVQGRNRSGAAPASSVPNGSATIKQTSKWTKRKVPYTDEPPDLPILTFRGLCNSTSGRLVITTQGMHFVRSSVTPNTIYASPTRAPLHTNPPDHARSHHSHNTSSKPHSEETANAETNIMWKRTWSELHEIRKLNTPRKLSTSLATSIDSSIPNAVHKAIHEKLSKLTTSNSNDRKSTADQGSETKKVNHSASRLSPSIGNTKALALIFTPGETIIVESMRKRDEAFNLIIGMSGIQFQVLQPLELNLKNSTLSNCSSSKNSKSTAGSNKSIEEQVKGDMPKVNVVPTSPSSGPTNLDTDANRNANSNADAKYYGKDTAHDIDARNEFHDTLTNIPEIQDLHTHDINANHFQTAMTDQERAENDATVDENTHEKAGQKLQMGNTQVRTEEAQDWLLPKVTVLATPS